MVERGRSSRRQKVRKRIEDGGWRMEDGEQRAPKERTAERGSGLKGIERGRVQRQRQLVAVVSGSSSEQGQGFQVPVSVF